MIDAGLVRLFEQEARAQLARVERCAPALAAAVPDRAAADEVARGLHTVKGSAGLVGFREAAELAGALEGLAGEVRAGRRLGSEAVAQALGAGAARLREVIALEATGGDARALVAGTLARVDALASPVREEGT